MLPLLVGFLMLELLIFALDVRELRRAGRGVGGASYSAIAFLLVVIGVFLAIQVGTVAMVPNVEDIFGFLRSLTPNDRDLPESNAALSVSQQCFLSISLFFVAGFWDYVVHRFFSHSRWFWPTHEYHHLPRELSVVMPGILGRPYAFIPGFLAALATGMTVLVVAVLRGEAMWEIGPVVPVLLAIVLVQTASHSCFLRRQWWLHRCMRWFLLTTPSEHVLHHALDSKCNYGTFTSCWDRLFGTYTDPTGIDLESLSVGLPYDQDFLGTLTFGRWKLSPGMRRRFEVERFCHVKTPKSSDQIP